MLYTRAEVVMSTAKLLTKGDGIAPLVDQIVEFAQVGMLPSRSSALEQETVF